MTQVPEGSPEAETLAGLREEAERGAEAGRFLESVLTAAPAFIMRVDGDERIVFLNQFAGGFRPDTLYGTPFTAFVPEPFLPAARAAVRAAIERGERGYYETEAEGPGGYYGYYVSHVAPLVNTDGTRHATVVAVDVTAQREREARLGAREAALRLAVEATGLATWDWEPRTGRVTWSERMRQVMGTADPLDPTGYLARVHPDDRAEVEAAWRRFQAGNAFEAPVHRILRDDGTERWLRLHAVTLRDDHAQSLRVVGACLDVTGERDRELRERQKNKMEAIGLLAAGIAHNFNNMLTAIVPPLDLLRQGASADDLPLIDGARHAARRATEMIRQLLTFAGRTTPRGRPRAESAGEVARRAAEMCRSIFPVGVELVEQRRGGADLVVPDAGAVEQVLVNVLINARDAVAVAAVAAPRIVLVVSPAPAAPGDTTPSVRITVEDNGPGVPDDLRERVFEPFFTTKGPNAGTGLGLASCYATVTSLGGRITCEAAPSGGARFVIDLPTLEAAGSPTTPLPPTAAPVTPCLVAIVDDDRDARRALARLVESGGHRVLELPSLDEATRALTNRADVGVVLLARTLADGRGTELLARVPDLPARAPTLLLAAGEVPEAEAQLVNGVVAKPVGRDALLAAIAATARR